MGRSTDSRAWTTETRAPQEGSVDSDFDRLADALLTRAERAIAKLELTDRQRSYLIRVLRSRLRSIVTLADRRSSPRKL
jgi:hypothetical protein